MRRRGKERNEKERKKRGSAPEVAAVAAHTQRCAATSKDSLLFRREIETKRDIETKTEIERRERERGGKERGGKEKEKENKKERRKKKER